MLIQILKWILVVSGSIVGTVYFYKWIYLIVGLFKTRQFPKANHYHRYAILIALLFQGVLAAAVWLATRLVFRYGSAQNLK